jgi:pSer/pThr/pTyr-binding forkhead associated (FHA) protein
MAQEERGAFAPHTRTPVELQAVLRAELVGVAFLLLRDRDGAQVIVALGERDRVTIGRAAGCDVALEWDASTSRVHAELVRVGTDWTVLDDGLSRNGTFVNGTRLAGRRRLSDGDTLRLGESAIVFRAPPLDPELVTIPTSEHVVDRERLTPMQLRVLRALCAPYVEDRLNALPATNQEIADALVLSVDGVKTHLRALFDIFGIAGLARGNKRTRLAQLALASGVVDLRVP